MNPHSGCRGRAGVQTAGGTYTSTASAPQPTPSTPVRRLGLMRLSGGRGGRERANVPWRVSRQLLVATYAAAKRRLRRAARRSQGGGPRTARRIPILVENKFTRNLRVDGRFFGLIVKSPADFWRYNLKPGPDRQGASL